MSLWIITFEAEDGTFWDDPLAWDTREEAVAQAKKLYISRQTEFNENNIVLNIYSCSYVETIGERTED